MQVQRPKQLSHNPKGGELPGHEQPQKQLLPRFKIQQVGYTHTADFLDLCFLASNFQELVFFGAHGFSQKQPSQLDSFSSDLFRHSHGTMVRRSHGGSVGGTCRPPSQTAADAQWPGVSRLPAAAGCNRRSQVETLCHVPTPLERSKTLWEGEKTEEGEETGWSLVKVSFFLLFFLQIGSKKNGIVDKYVSLRMR